MMKFQIVLYVLIFLMLSSCYNVHKYFYIYKTPLTIKQQKQDIKTNGIYLISESNNDHSPIFMFLYIEKPLNNFIKNAFKKVI